MKETEDVQWQTPLFSAFPEPMLSFPVVVKKRYTCLFFVCCFFFSFENQTFIFFRMTLSTAVLILFQVNLKQLFHFPKTLNFFFFFFDSYFLWILQSSNRQMDRFRISSSSSFSISNGCNRYLKQTNTTQSNKHNRKQIKQFSLSEVKVHWPQRMERKCNLSRVPFMNTLLMKWVFPIVYVFRWFWQVF